MLNVNQSRRSLRIISDSMYDPANHRDSFMAGDYVIVESDQDAKDGDFVIVKWDDSESVMKLTIQNDVRLFKYTAPERSDFCLTGEDIAITGVVTERHRPYVLDMDGPLKWLGDDIGLCKDTPIRVNLADRRGCTRMVFLREALMVVDKVDEADAQRITSALSFSAEHGYLRRMDLDVWNSFQSDRVINETREVAHG